MESSMKYVHGQVISLMLTLSDVWNEEEVKNYPSYLPSFDEFIVDFKKLLEE